MNKKLLITLAVTSLSLVACSKEGDFKKAINTNLSQKPACLNIKDDGGRGDGFYLDEKQLQAFRDKTKGLIVNSQRFDKNGKNLETDRTLEQRKKSDEMLGALVTVGLLTKSTESLPTIGSWPKKPDGGYYLYTIYTLTEAGKKTEITVKPSLSMVAYAGDTGHRTFCYAKREVASIDNYAEGNSEAGFKIATVEYTYKFTDVADWVYKPAFKAMFPKFVDSLNTKYTDTITLVKKNNGWEAVNY
ncbi:MAG TPA: hypothetical protein PLP75_09925 [Burkholderiales bacterium]|nr:hypothetical protein [Burkholderiales bacterium]